MNTIDHRYERPAVSITVCAPAHEWFVGRLDVPGAVVDRPSLAKLQDQLSQQKSVQQAGVRSQAQGSYALPTNGSSTAKPTGMAKSPATVGAGASGVPPRGRPV
ncbi:hypothetical protein GCM10023322_23190 [Rugosimonospora acidiphila]|uniref:Uncharacterized protein n=1 Tax=Rugosimonospora acidiphila TaxID=556531 RepID=A0ABP9RQP0_9ACTN